MLSSQWPSLLAQLDRGASLTPTEKITLSSWVCHAPSGAGSALRVKTQEVKELQRLLDPIETVFAYCKYDSGSRRNSYACCELLLQEMHERQSTLWAWDEDVWLEIVGNSSLDFKDRYSDFHLGRRDMSVQMRPFLINCAYLLGDIAIHQMVANCCAVTSARYIFGWQAVATALGTVDKEIAQTGRTVYDHVSGLSNGICLALLLNRNAALEQITISVLKQVCAKSAPLKTLRQACITLSQSLCRLGILPTTLPPDKAYRFPPQKRTKAPIHKGKRDSLPAVFLQLLEAWGKASIYRSRTIESQRSRVAKILRWALASYPSSALPHQWTIQMAKKVVPVVTNMRIGEYNNSLHQREHPRAGHKFKPAVMAQILNALRSFFIFCRDEKQIQLRFDPAVYLRTPAAIIAEIRPSPKAIEDEIWEKLEQAGLTLTQDDLPHVGSTINLSAHEASYPLEMVRALALVWLFGGLRQNEILRLQRSCIQLPPTCHGSASQQNLWSNIHILRIPINKSSDEFDKPVDCRLGEAVLALEQLPLNRRWRQDETSKQQVHFLFEWCGQSISKTYINQVLIPLLCRKAGISEYDSKGRIHCHRARATLATRYYKAGLGVEELRRWLGHGVLTTLGYYLDLDPIWRNSTFSQAISVTWRQRYTSQEPDVLLANKPPQALLSVEQETEFSEAGEEELTPDNYLDHLWPSLAKSVQSFSLQAFQSLSDVLRNVSLSIVERQDIVGIMGLLDRITCRA